MTIMTALIIIWIFFGLLTANIADSKGRPFWTWLIYGFLCFPLAILYLAMSKPSDETLVSSGEYRKCPYCAEVIKEEALVCRYCGRDLPKSEPGATIDYSNGIAEINKENKDRFNDK